MSVYSMKDKICDKLMSFSDCELAILRMQVDEAEAKIAKRIIKTDETQEMIAIVENFIKKKMFVMEVFLLMRYCLIRIKYTTKILICQITTFSLQMH